MILGLSGINLIPNLFENSKSISPTQTLHINTCRRLSRHPLSEVQRLFATTTLNSVDQTPNYKNSNSRELSSELFWQNHCILAKTIPPQGCSLCSLTAIYLFAWIRHCINVSPPRLLLFQATTTMVDQIFPSVSLYLSLGRQPYSLAPQAVASPPPITMPTPTHHLKPWQLPAYGSWHHKGTMAQIVCVPSATWPVLGRYCSPLAECIALPERRASLLIGHPSMHSKALWPWILGGESEDEEEDLFVIIYFL